MDNEAKPIESSAEIEDQNPPVLPAPEVKADNTTEHDADHNRLLQNLILLGSDCTTAFSLGRAAGYPTALLQTRTSTINAHGS